MTDATHVDGNALGGLLTEVFGREMTDAHGRLGVGWAVGGKGRCRSRHDGNRSGW